MSLSSIGYKTYDDYLKSDRWQQIRDQVFGFYGKRCYFCQSSKFVQCHHLEYSHKILLEGNLLKLIPLCRDCHKRVTRNVKINGYTEFRATELIAKEFNIILPTPEKIGDAKIVLVDVKDVFNKKLVGSRKTRRKLKKLAKKNNSKKPDKTHGMPAVLFSSVRSYLVNKKYMSANAFVSFYETKINKRKRKFKYLYAEYRHQVYTYVSEQLKPNKAPTKTLFMDMPRSQENSVKRSNIPSKGQYRKLGVFGLKASGAFQDQ